MKKYDERETLFSRIALEKNTKNYKEFYKKNPEYRKKDDALRTGPFRSKIRKSDRFKELFLPLNTPNKKLIKSLFYVAHNYPVNKQRVSIPKSFSKNIKEITKHYGATDVGIVSLTDYNYYSHFGGVSEHLDIENYGNEIKPSFKTAIVFTVKMNLEMMNRAPHYEELLTTENEYVNVAMIGSRLEMYLKELGYKAQSQNGEFYMLPLVPLAYDAGLGEIGMCNHIVTKEHGNNVRLGAVLTTLELNYDKPELYGLTELCQKCALCLMNCPSKAITHKKRTVNNRPWYKFDDNKCYEQWQKMGTDCGTCIQACPLTQGVDINLLNKMKNNEEVMDQIMKEHYDKYGRRNYIKGDLPIVTIEED